MASDFVSMFFSISIAIEIQRSINSFVIQRLQLVGRNKKMRRGRRRSWKHSPFSGPQTDDGDSVAGEI